MNRKDPPWVSRKVLEVWRGYLVLFSPEVCMNLVLAFLTGVAQQWLLFLEL